MTASSAYVIAGAGLAGAKAAETLRGEGFDGPVVLIGDEAERPYERPPLSKDYLLGKAEREAIYVHPAAWYADNGVELRLGVRAGDMIQALVRGGRTVDPGRLADPGVPLDELGGD
jgi:NADPH-dependent 2,4-dienoyl-CoA reductase/sulfur reductase-like enzyme